MKACIERTFQIDFQHTHIYANVLNVALNSEQMCLSFKQTLTAVQYQTQQIFCYSSNADLFLLSQLKSHKKSDIFSENVKFK